MPKRPRAGRVTTADRRRPRAVLETLETRYLFAQSIWAYPGLDGKLLYKPLPLSDKIQDFSNVGYKGGLESIPDVTVKVTVSPIAGDDQANIQAAIDAVEAMPLDANGFRGAVVLNPGTYEIPGTLVINTSGVVLRGSGQGQTILLATGTEKDTTVQLDGNAARTVGTRFQIADKYVPVGAISFSLAPSAIANFAVGDTVMIRRTATPQWLHDIGADQVVEPWTSRNVDMDRTITRIDGNVITLDAPLTHALEQSAAHAYGGGTIGKYTAAGRISNVGVEYITGRSTFNAAELSGSDRIDEDHAEHFIGVDGVINGWVRNVTSEFYGYACVNMTGPSKWITVQDSQCLDPVSVVTGGRRYSFNMGDSTNVLWQNLYTRSGRHDYVQGSEVTGPNVVVDSRADAARSDTGPHHRYSTGTLWDNLDVNGNAINIQNRWNSGSGHGWAGANQVVWNSEANSFIIQNIGFPNTAWNWAIGNIGTQQTGDFIAPDNTQVGSQGLYDSHGTKVDTRSLFRAQMAEKLALDNRFLREIRLGDADNYEIAAGDVQATVDAAWKTAVESTTGLTGVSFDVAGSNQLVPFTFNFGIDAGTYVAGASLSIGYKNTGGSSAGDTIFFESTGRRYTWADLGVAPPTASQGAVVIDLSNLLPALQDGMLNLAISGNTAIDWATLNFQTASVTSPKSTTLIATDDAQVSQAAPTTSFGASGSMNTKRNGATDNFESYLRFDVTSISGTITNAYVRLVPTTVGVAPSTVSSTFGNATGAIFNRLSFVQSDTWIEGALNWSNKPPADPFFREFIAAPNEPLLFDVTSLVRAAQAGDKKLSLALSTYIDNAASQVTYATSEHGTAAFRPQLVIESIDSVGAVADVYVRGGVNAGSNFGTATDIAIKNDSSTNQDNDREGYLRFDLNGLASAPGNGFLRLMPFNVPATLLHSAQLVSDDTWSETGITWNSKPAGGAVLGSWTPVVGQYTSVNVSAAAQSAYTTDKRLSVKIVSDTSSTAAPIQYSSREHANELFRPLLMFSNLAPSITAIPNVATSLNTPVSNRWFGVWDAETPLNALTVSATSSNTTLLPNANITLAGSGIDRTFSLTPTAGQSGTSNVTITVTDAQGVQSQATFQLVVSSAATIDGDQSTPNQDDTFLVVRNGANVNVFRNGVLVADVPQPSAGAIQVNGLGGSDTFIVDYSAGNPIPAGGLLLDGGAGTDTFRAMGTSAADAVTLTAGNVAFASAGAFAYATGETLELQLGTGADTLTVAGNPAVTTQTLLLNLGGGGSLAMAAASTLPDFTDVSLGSGTTFNLSGQNQAIDALAGSGTVLNDGPAAATLTVGSQGSNSTFAGSLANGTQTLALTKGGAGTLVLSGANSYTGVSTLAGGVLESGNAASFAALTGAVQFLGGTFRVTADTVSANVANKWTTTFAGASGTNTGTFDIAAGVTLTLGVAGGSAIMRTGGGTNAGGSFIKTGAGTLRILVGNNQQDDPILLNGGTIVAEHIDALGRGDSGVRVDMKGGTMLVLKSDAADPNFQTPINAVDAGGAINVTIDRLTSGAAVANPHAVNALTAAGAFTLNISKGANITSGEATFAIGSATLGGNATLSVGASAVLNITGAITGGAFGVTKTGTGALLLNGVNTYTGDTIVSGAFGGAGTIGGNLVSSGTVRPGSVAGNSAGVLTIIGNLTASDVSGSLDFELNGPTAGADYDRLAVAGMVTLGGKRNVALNYAALTGTVFTIIDNAGSDAVVGTFADLPEGATIFAGGRALRISYVGGDGNDVTLTVLPPPAVAGVFVAGSAWNASFLNFLASSGTGDGTYGFRLDAASHADELPWTNINRLSIRFSEDVSINEAALTVYGVNVAQYAFAPSTFAYDAATFTATWTLTSAVAADKLLLALDADAITGAGGVLLDGEWTNPTPPAAGAADAFPSGDSFPGGDFLFRVNVLPGDTSRNGIVQSSDALPIQASLLTAPGNAGYTIVRDVNGNGILQSNDFLAVQARLLTALPASEPTVPAPASASLLTIRTPFASIAARCANSLFVGFCYDIFAGPPCET